MRAAPCCLVRPGKHSRCGNNARGGYYREWKLTNTIELTERSYKMGKVSTCAYVHIHMCTLILIHIYTLTYTFIPTKSTRMGKERTRAYPHKHTCTLIPVRICAYTYTYYPTLVNKLLMAFRQIW